MDEIIENLNAFQKFLNEYKEKIPFEMDTNVDYYVISEEFEKIMAKKRLLNKE